MFNAFQVFRTWLLDRKQRRTWLIIVDNADDADVLLQLPGNTEATESQDSTEQTGTAERCLDFLPYYEHGSLLVTPRSKAVALGAVNASDIIDINPMDEIQALTVLQQKLSGALTANQEFLVQLVTELEFMPLAITQAAAYIEAKAPRCSVKEYLEELSRSKLSLLNHDSPDLRRDRAAQNCILKTLQISFEQIRQDKSSAADLLALMSFCDRHAIPEMLLHNRHLEQRSDSSASSPAPSSIRESIKRFFKRQPTPKIQSHTKPKQNESSKGDSPAPLGGQSQDTFDDDLRILRNNSLVSVTTYPSEFEMHRLVQLATQDWLKICGSFERWGTQFMTNLDAGFPMVSYGTELQHINVCQQLYPHAVAAIGIELTNRESLLWQASVLDKGGLYAHEMCRFTESLEMNKLSLKHRQILLGPSHSNTLHSMRIVGVLYCALDQYEKAEDLLIEVLQQRKQVNGGHDERVRTMCELATIYQLTRRLDEADQLQREALVKGIMMFGEEDIRTLRVMSDLARIMVEQGQYEAVERQLKKVLEIHVKLHREIDSIILVSTQYLGQIYFRTGRLAQARRQFDESLQVCMTLYGRDHPCTLVSMDNISLTLGKLSRRRSATKLMRECVEKSHRVLGPGHKETVRRYKILGGWETEDESHPNPDDDEADTEGDGSNSEEGMNLVHGASESGPQENPRRDLSSRC